MPIKGNAYISDTGQFGSVTVTSNGTTNFNSTIIRNIARAVELTDAVTLGQLLESSSLASSWATYPATANVNINSNNIYSTVSQTFISGNNTFTLDVNVLSNISTFGTGGQAAFSSLSNDFYLLSTTLISTISTWVGAYGGSGGGGSDPTLTGRVAALELFSTAQTGSNIRYDGISTAFSSLSNNFYLLSTTLISTISTWVGAYGGSGGGGSDPTLTGRVVALEVFSTAQTGSNIRYDGVSTAFSSINSITVQTSTNLSTLSYYVLSLVSYNIEVRNQLSSLNPISVQTSTNLSTLSYYVLSLTSYNIEVRNQLSTISSNLSVNTAVQATRKIVGTNEVVVGGTSPTAAGMIVSTYISTNGYLNVFENTTGTTGNIELKLSTLGIWPNNAYDTMRFAHYGNTNNVNIYAEDSTYTDGLLAVMAPGDTLSFIYRGSNPSYGANTRISTVSYYRVRGY